MSVKGSPITIYIYKQIKNYFLHGCLFAFEFIFSKFWKLLAKQVYLVIYVMNLFLKMRVTFSGLKVSGETSPFIMLLEIILH